MLNLYYEKYDKKRKIYYPWFDSNWYLDKYPVKNIPVESLIDHYLEIGENLGYRPCPDFDPIWYKHQYPDVVVHKYNALQHFISHGLVEGRYPCKLYAPSLDNALWTRRDEVNTPLKTLQNLVACDSVLESSYASFALARWYAWQSDWQVAADYLAKRATEGRLLPGHNGPSLLLIEALTRSGQFSRAWFSLSKLQQAAPGWTDIYLASANLLAYQAEKAASCELFSYGYSFNKSRLSWINSAWVRSGLCGVELADANFPISMDNLISYSLGSKNISSPLVTVIVPAFNASKTIGTALNSLTQQRGVNLEIIVVDDASTDDTSEVVEVISQHDSRIYLLQHSCNKGAYASRNSGLRAARGDFITVHDSDDWSHPEKLANQVNALQAHPEWQACCTHWVRCSQDLIFSRWRMEEGWVYRNVSSLMFRRRVFEQLGYWDQVRAEADTEYYYRIQAAFGSGVIGEVLRGVPLTFGRMESNSLTSAEATHMATQFGGVRSEYRSASQAWHQENLGHPSQLYMSTSPDGRPFSAPQELLP